jgi:hypothetical protein
MRAFKQNVFLGLTLSTLLCSSGAAVADMAELHKELEDFFEINFPGEGFIATAYGADDRYAPKNIWIKLDHAQKAKGWRRQQEAWFVFSNGRSVYTDELVPIQRKRINPQTWKFEKNAKWAFALALIGNLYGQEIDADLGTVFGSGLNVDIEFGEVEIEYGFYSDFLLAQKVRQYVVEAMNALLRERFAKVPERRVITAVIRVRGAVATVEETKNRNVNLGLLSGILARLGFKWTQDKTALKSLKTGDWKYVGYQALITREDTTISTAEETSKGSDYKHTSLPTENHPWGLIDTK